MKRIISEELLSNIATYMDDDIREWCHDVYMGKDPEDFLRSYYLRLVYEKGIEAGENFKGILYYEFNIDIYDYVTIDDEDEADERYRKFNIDIYDYVTIDDEDEADERYRNTNEYGRRKSNEEI